jgi:hypothetical protein
MDFVYRWGDKIIWSASNYYIQSRSKVHLSVMVKHSTYTRDKIRDKHFLSPIKKWITGKNYTYSWGFVEGLCRRVWMKVGRSFTLGWIHI